MTEEEKPKKRTRKTKAKPGVTDIVVDEAQLAESTQSGHDILEFVSTWAITTQDDMDDAGTLLRDVVERKKELEEELKSFTDPLRTMEKRLRDKWRPPTEYYKSAEVALKSAIRTFELRRIAAQKEALAAVAEQGVDADSATLALAHGHGQVATTEAVRTRQVLKWKLVDEAAVPEKYFVRVLNTAMIDAELKLTKESFKVPGIEVFEDIEIANKAASR